MSVPFLGCFKHGVTTTPPNSKENDLIETRLRHDNGLKRRTIALNMKKYQVRHDNNTMFETELT